MRTVAVKVRIRNADDTADAVVLSTVPGVGVPCLLSVPTGDGTGTDAYTGSVTIGGYTVEAADQVTSADGAPVTRVLTAVLEDAGGRAALLGRRSYVATAFDGTWTERGGWLTALKLARAGAWSLSIGDSRRMELRAQMFAPRVLGVDGAGQPVLESIAAFLARWPRRGALLGGPLVGPAVASESAWPGETGPMQCQVSAVASGLAKCVVRVAGGPPATGAPTPTVAGFRDLGGSLALVSLPAAAAERTAARYDDRSSASTATDRYPTLLAAVRLRSEVGTATAIRWHTLATPPLTIPGISTKTDAPAVVNRLLQTFLSAAALDGRTLSAGQDITVSVVTRVPSDVSPLYYTLHPVDIAANAWTAAGIAYDAASVEACRAILGADRRFSARVTAPQPLADYLERAVLAPFRLTIRPSGAGWELVPLAPRYRAAPTITLASADLGDTGIAWDQSDATAYTRVSVTGERYLLPGDPAAQEADTASVPPDGVLTRPLTVERITGDEQLVPARTLSLAVPGCIHRAGQAPGASDLAVVATDLAIEVADRNGRGARMATFRPLLGTPAAAARIGDELSVAVAHLPNGNVRLGDDPSALPRTLQVLQATPDATSVTLRLLDSGTLAQPLAVTPTLTIAAGANRGDTTATLTNASALNALSAGLRLQLATTPGSSPPALTDGADVAVYAPGALPSGAVALPAVLGGQYAWARGRSESPTHRPGVWSTWVGVSVPGLNPPTAVVADPDATDGARAALVWVTGANAAPAVVDVWRRYTSDAAGTEALVTTLPAGSTRYDTYDLAPAVAYTLLVSHRDPVTGETSPRVAATLTTAATATALPAPTRPTAWVTIPGLGGLAVAAATTAGAVLDVEVEAAAETAVGSGTYGSYATVARVPGVADDWTVVALPAPSAGLRYQMRARSVRGTAGADDFLASGYTTSVTVQPWGDVVRLIPYAEAVGAPGPKGDKGDPGTPGTPGAPGVAVSCVAVVGGTATTSTVTVTTLPAGGTVRLVASSATRTSGPAAGVDSAGGTAWTFTRPAFGAGDLYAQFRATVSGGSDDDVAVIGEQGRDTVPSRLLVRQIAADDAGITYRISAATLYADRAGTLTLLSAAGVVGTVNFDGPLGAGFGVGGSIGLMLSQTPGYEGAQGANPSPYFYDVWVPRPAPGSATPATPVWRIAATGCAPDLDDAVVYAVGLPGETGPTGPAGPAGAPGTNGDPGSAVDPFSFLTITPRPDLGNVFYLGYALASGYAGVDQVLAAVRTFDNGFGHPAGGAYSEAGIDITGGVYWFAPFPITASGGGALVGGLRMIATAYELGSAYPAKPGNAAFYFPDPSGGGV